MYYKDNYIEFRIGIGIKDFKTMTDEVYSLAHIREVENEEDILIQNFTTSTTLTEYPIDGTYKLHITGTGGLNYYVYFTINDSFIAEFVKQVESIVCKCSCSDEDATPCGGNKKNAFCLKRQKLFNLTTILPYTIKPFSTGNPAISNPYLFKFFQLYFNEILDEKREELGEEYTNYFLHGTNNINTKLFNSLIINLYYSLYYYSKLFLITDVTSETELSYTSTINTFFNFNNLKACFKCNNIATDIEQLMIDVIEDPCFCTSVEPIPVPNPIIASNVLIEVPRIIVDFAAIFDSNFNSEDIVDLSVPFNNEAKFLTIVSIQDVDSLVIKGNNLVQNIVETIESIPNNSIPINVSKTIQQENSYNNSAILTCYVTDKYGQNSNVFTVTFILSHTAIPLVEDLLVTIDNFTEAASTVDYKNLISYYTIASIGAGTTLSSVVWSIISTEFVFDGGVAFNPAYSVDASVGGGSASYSNLTPGYRYIVQLYCTNDVAQDCTFLMALDVLG